MFEARRAGNLDIVQWLLEAHKLPVIEAFKAAQEKHQWGIVRWILTNCDIGNHTVDVIGAAGDAELEILQWVYEHQLAMFCGRVLFSTEYVLLETAAFNGHLDVVKWLHDNFAKVKLNSYVFTEAARGGHLDMIKWLHSHECPAEATAMDVAAEGGFLEVVKWIDANRKVGCTSIALYDAGSNGHLKVVKWHHREVYATAKRIYCPFVMDSAAKHGHLEVVKWLHEHSSEECTEAAMDDAAWYGHLDIVKWLHEHRSEGCSVIAMDWAAARGHLDVVKWLHAHRSEGCTTWAMDSAADKGHLDVLKWLHQHRRARCTTQAMDSAAANGHLNIVRWLHNNRSGGCTSTSMASALAEGHFDVVLFLRQERLMKVSCPVVIDNPRLELVQWLLQNAAAELEGVSIRVSRGD